MLTVLFSTLMRYNLVEKLYPATVAGIEYSCFASDRGIVLKVKIVEYFAISTETFIYL